jgi:hypothetical protein
MNEHQQAMVIPNRILQFNLRGDRIRLAMSAIGTKRTLGDQFSNAILHSIRSAAQDGSLGTVVDQCQPIDYRRMSLQSRRIMISPPTSVSRAAAKAMHCRTITACDGGSVPVDMFTMTRAVAVAPIRAIVLGSILLL